jgi:hypothetical protein
MVLFCVGYWGWGGCLGISSPISAIYCAFPGCVVKGIAAMNEDNSDCHENENEKEGHVE